MKTKQFNKPATARTGKDIRRLLDEKSKPVQSTGYNDFTTSAETALAAIWKDLLGHQNFGRDDDFFQVGGNSLKAVQMVSRIATQLHIDISLTSIFLQPTIAQIGILVNGNQNGKTAVANSISITERPDVIPLSFNQERLWFIDQMQGTVQYHIPAVLRLEGQVNVDALSHALKTVTNRHEVLRTVISVNDGVPRQYINSEGKWTLQRTDWFAQHTDNLPLTGYIQQVINAPFNLSKDYMLRAELILLNEAKSILVVTMHHIASDGWSMSVLVNEVIELYTAVIEERLPRLAPLKVQYADYAIWQKKQLATDLFEEKLSYWRNKLEGTLPLQLPTDFSRPLEQTLRGSITGFTIPAPLSADLQALCQQQGTTLFMVLLAAFKVLLYRYSRQEDMVVGTPVANRANQETENLIGFFVNTIALRSQVKGDMSFTEMLQQIKVTALEGYEHQEVPFEKVVEAVVKERDLSRSPLVQVMLIVQNTPDIPEVRLGDVKLTTEQVPYPFSKFDLSLSVTETAEGMVGSFEYSTDLYRSETIDRMIGHFKQLLLSVTEAPNQQVDRLSMLTNEEEQSLLHANHNFQSGYPKGKTVVAIIEEQAAKTSQAIAIIFEDKQFTYQQLNERSNRLAHYLVSIGIREETLVPLCMERGMEMIIAILAILKTGGAYVPIEPDAPVDRIGFMLQDTAAAILLTSSTSKPALPADNAIQLIEIGTHWPAINQLPTHNLSIPVQPQHLAYVIYTSGSTGQPKGVMVQHGSLLNYLVNSQPQYTTGNKTNAGSFVHLPYTFDASLTALFMPLLCGKSIVIASPKSANVFEDANLLKHAPYDFIKITPSHFALLQPTLQPGNTNWITGKLVVGGEALYLSHFHLLKGLNMEVINEYGPTEATVGCSTYTVHTASLYTNYNLGHAIPIGKPIDNTELYILDNLLQLVPIGVAGELCIGGIQVSRGYLNLPELTAEKFIPNPFDATGNSRLYRSGDLARWLPDGNIEYLGRRDEQVKISSYRIELSEIETAVQQSKLVHQSVVIAKETGAGAKRLMAYVVPAENYSREALITYLHSRLPEYMVPNLWMQVTSIPLTPNGKVDKKALPDVEDNSIATNVYAAPGNELEQQLVAAWQNLLGTEQVSIHDNFFELGGDSILTIQVVSRMRRLGYDLHPKDIFLHQTIARLSAAITDRLVSAAAGEQGILTGSSGLLPIQQWYLEKELAAVSHYNQAVLLGIDKSVTETRLKTVIAQLCLRHDALRFSYRQVDGGGWQQEYGQHKGMVVSEDLQAATDKRSLETLIKQTADYHQGLLNIEKGELVRVVLMQTDTAESHNRLLVIIHHLGIDGVSWRILLEDMEVLLNATGKVHEDILGQKSISYRQWYQALERYGQSRGLSSQKGYWQHIIDSYEPQPVDKPFEGKVSAGNIRHHSIRLNAKHTLHLLQEVPRAYHTEINDTLLCALSTTLCNWAGKRKVVIGLEGHGREAIDNDINTSRTVGWFTSLYPVLLQMDIANDSDELGGQIKSVKEQLRLVPNRGLGYGILKYINREEVLQSSISEWDIVFNYLGQLDNVVKESKWLTAAGESTGASVNELYEGSEKLSINSFVQSGELVVNLDYSGLHYEAATIIKFASAFISKLEELIVHCLQQLPLGPVYTPSDYGLGAAITYRELDTFMEEPFGGKQRKEQVKGMYRLSGLQQGMLFHGFYDEERKETYTEQFTCDLLDVDPGHFKKSWQHIIHSHSILRSSFYYNVFSIPVQCVYREVSLPVAELDYRGMSRDEQAAAVMNYEVQDRRKGFDFESAPLMRIGLLQLSDNRYRMVWTFHHILFDGWSLSVLVEEFLSAYQLLASEQVVSRQEDKYEDYIRYVERSNKEGEEHYWRHYLQGVEQRTLLPFITGTRERTMGSGNYRHVSLELDTKERLQAYAQRHRLTVNTVMQGVWSLLLHGYTGNRDVVYGVTVAGRPEELAGIEKRVGMYINTLPLRSSMDEAQNLTDWLTGLQNGQVSSRQYQYTALPEIQGWVGAQGALFDSILVFENYPLTHIIGSDKWPIGIEHVAIHEQTNYPLTIIISIAEKINIKFSYNTALLAEVYVKEIANHFKHVLLQVIADNEAGVQDIKLITEAEEAQLLKKFNDTELNYPEDKTIVHLFEEQVTKTPDAIAVVFEDRELTYNELNEKVNRLANYLRKNGVTKETLVPVCLERSMEMIIAILAILKAGGAYVPVDNNYPTDRINFILEDTAATLIICNSESEPALPDTVEIIKINIEDDRLFSQPGFDDNPKAAITPQNLAYVMYTSGSTGKPKGVLVEHGNVVSLVKSSNYVSLTGSNILLSTGSVSFDATTFEYWGMLLNGGRLILCAQDVLLDSQLLKKEIALRKVNIMWFTSSWLNQLVDSDISVFEGLETILAGGERLSEKHIGLLKKTYPEINIINGYGPTENTTFSLTCTITEVDANNPIPIGKPLSNRTALVLNKYGQLMPVGVAGEICLGGAGLARGYLNQPCLTAEKFIKNTYHNLAGVRLYKTGDIGRWLPDGNMEYLGRKDEQVKINGFRIELGEIESVLQQCESVETAVVVAEEDDLRSKRLIGYIVPQGLFNQEDISSYLKSKLPAYMVPALWVEMAVMPLTSNGKINRKALPHPDVSTVAAGNYVAPVSETESVLVEIWKGLLGAEQRIGVQDNFFEIGGHSLLAMRLMFSIRRDLNVDISIRDIFLHTTIAELAKCIEEQNRRHVLPGIEVQQRPANIPLSYGQERLWFIDRLEGSIQYHVPIVLRIKGTVNEAALSTALHQIIKRHEVLRTVFKEQDGQAYQYISDAADWRLLTSNGAVFSTDKTALQQHIRQLVNTPFDLSKDAMLRAEWISLSHQESMLVLILHHIAADAWSLPVMIREFQELFTAHLEQRPVKLHPLPVQYADYAIWQRNYLSGSVLDKKIQYWKEKLNWVAPLLLPTDHERPVIQGVKGAAISFTIDKEQTVQLKDISRQQDTTLFMTLLAAFNVLLHQYSGQDDICVGTPIANRTHTELENLIGFFLNTLAIRSEADSHASFTELLQQVKTTTLEAFEHQDVPFEKVVEAVVKERDLSRNPLFQVMFVLLHKPDTSLGKIGATEFSIEPYQHNISRFDLILFAEETDNGLTCIIEYNTDLYVEATILKLTGHFTELLHSIIQQPQQKIGALNILGHTEKEQLLEEFNHTKAAYPKDKTIIDLFEAQVAKTPIATAVVFNEVSLTYQQLNEQANQLAHYLQNNGVERGTLVPVCLDRSLEMIVSVIAVLKAGGVYVPIDPEYPSERIRYMLEDTDAAIIISSRDSRVKLPAFGGRILEINGADAPAISRQPQSNLSVKVSENHLAYIIYTSGSTGRPKGVKMGGSGLVNLLNWQEKQFTNKHRRVLQFASLNFDVSFQEIFSTLCYGSSLYLITDDDRRDMGELFKHISRHQLTHLFIPYIVLKNLVEYILSFSNKASSLEEIMVAGEQLKLTDDIQAFIKGTGVQVINQYGPTEAHVVSSYTINNNEALPALPPIGKPIDNTQLYILGDAGQPVPTGVYGELFIGGVQVAHGYLNQPDLTNEKFGENPFSKEGGRMYKTGDMARWLADGNIEYLGRRDDQVKIRGYRIELGEVESTLQGCALVRQAVVLAKTDITGNKLLVAYIVPEGFFDKPGIVSYLKNMLPDYMVPAFFVEIDKLPVTANGKVNRRALPDPDINILTENAYIPPRSATEEQLANIWQELLGIERIGIKNNFFELGGHSLLATRVISAIRSRLQVEVAIKELFLHPTIAALAAHLSVQESGFALPPIKKVAPRPAHIPLSFSQERLWFIDKLEGTPQYHLPAILRLKGKLNKAVFVKALQHIINRHEILRTAIKEEQGKSYQYIKDSESWKLHFTDGAFYNNNREGLQQYIAQLIKTPFDLSADYMFRAHLLELGEDDHIVVVTMHHIAADGWSISIIIKELIEIYDALLSERPVMLPLLPIQYADYAIWQRNYLQGQVLNSKLAYWNNKLQGVTTLELPADFQRPAIQSTRGATTTFAIDEQLTRQLLSLSRQQETTLFMTLLAAFNILLQRYSGQNDICIGTPVAGRDHREVEPLIGLFINTLALRSNLSNNPSFIELLQQVKNTSLEAYAHQQVPFEKVVEAVGTERDRSRNPLFQVLLTLHNTPPVPELRFGKMVLTTEEHAHTTSQLDIICDITETDKGLQGLVEYCTDLFKKETIEKMMAHFKQLLQAIVQSPQQRLSSFSMLSREEEQQLLHFSNTEGEDRQPATILPLFEAQAAKTPGHIAIVYKEAKLTYAQLNEQANQLARYLQARGVKAAQPVPVCLPSGPELLIAILALFKAGAVYVPIDPHYPQERISYLLDDTAAATVITSSRQEEQLAEIWGGHPLLMDSDWEMISMQANENLHIKPAPDQLAYIIYTSGSTGRPKGVMIEHNSLYNYLVNSKTSYINKTTNERAGSFVHLSPTFDASLTALLMPLLAGKAVVISSGHSVNVFEDSNLHKYAPYDFIKLTPAHLPLLQPKMQTGNGSLLTSKLVIGGEALLQSQVQYFAEEGLAVTIINEYGPTEATVGCSVFSLNTIADKNNISKHSSISIGKPIDHAEIYILGEDNALLPIGISGELCIGGTGLARGYLNQPELTATKFIPHPYSKEPGARLYRTGDIARWMPDGNIEYLGRRDEQVKIKGYRIELSEIESVLQDSSLVKQAVVLVKETGEGNKQLIAYIVTNDDAGYNREELQLYAKAKLPEYMVPVKWMEMEAIPLTTNGKVDRRNLPDPDVTAQISDKYVAPRNPLEEVLAGIWQELLDVERVGIHDNFFELGGDSIIIIQIVSRARRAGYEFQVADIFAHQSIAKLSATLNQQKDNEGSEGGSNGAGEQEMLQGESGLLPIQQWYFEENGGEAVSHYNQSVLLGISKAVTEADLRYVLGELATHHDALRFVYSKNEETENWQQSYGTNGGLFVAEDLRSTEKELVGQRLREQADYYHQTMELEKGELVRMIWAQMPDTEEQNRLLIIIHHLAIDGVSWRILLDDMEVLLDGVTKGEQVKLGNKSSSYRQWYNALQQYGQTNKLLSQVNYWEKIVGQYEPLVTDKNYDAEIKLKDTAVQKVSLSAAHTRALLQDVPKAYRTEVNDILLAALAITLCNWQRMDSVVIGMEGHGREEIGNDIDISRTVGWFTSHYPVLLKAGNKEVSTIIKETKEQLRRVPGKGLGYGILKYINKQESIAGKKSWDVSFNYFGQLDNVVNNSRWFTAAGEFDTAGISEEHIISELLSVNGLVQAGQLELIWRYSKLHFEADAVINLTQQYKHNLELIIAHCKKQENAAPVFTPSDYGLGDEVSIDELDNFLNEPYKNSTRRDWIDGLYRLTGLQQGMLFHGLYDNRAGAYTEQLSCKIKRLDLAAFKKSWNAVINNHSILRSGFYYKVFSIPVQCVYRQVEMPFALLDYRGKNVEEQAELLKAYGAADLAQGFDFKSVPLMRITLIRLSDEVYRMLWTSHHILFDGWSLPVMMEDFLTTYDLLVAGKTPVKAEVDKYEDYIRYLERYDKEAAEEYWSGYLKGTQSTLLPFIPNIADRTKGVGLYQSEYLKLGKEKTGEVERFLQQNHITLNTLMQGIWAWLLHNYTGSNNVVYGVTVSGRPDDLSDVERRVGMYINTLPFRSGIAGKTNIVPWLQGLQQDQVSSRKYQYTSLPEIQAATEIKGELFDSLLIVENYPVNKVVAARTWNLEIENLAFAEQTNYPLSLIISNVEEINIDFSYNAELLKDNVVHVIRNHFENVLLQIIKNSETRLGDIELITLAEKEQLLVTFNDTSATYPPHQTIIDLLEAQAANTPDAVAVIMEDEQLTYRQLHEQANQLAHHLQSAGVTNNTLVPVYMERSVKMIVGMLGILKAGGAYVPVDPAYPAERILFTLEDTDAEIIVSSKQGRAKLPENAPCTVVSLDEDWPLISSQPVTNPATAIDATDLAYVIYTSGSTGKPKGVMIQHQNVYAFINWCQQEFASSRFEIAYAGTSICFDLSVFEIFYPLSIGKPIRLLENGLQISKYVDGDAFVMTNSVPAVIQSLLTDNIDLTNISVLNMAGEPIPISVRQGLDTDRIEVRNLYGPSEDTTYSTMSRVRKNEEITIGKPISNTRIYILNERQQLVPVGVTGEICIGGAGVAKGYLNRPELTAEKFIKNPFSANGGAKMYRTGDWGRWLADGNIAYLGRMDDQVKVRGYRIELGEIESVLQQSEWVSKAAVLSRQDSGGNKQLVAYVVPKGAFNKELLITHLKLKLPAYMIPGVWVALDDMPATPNGKINRKALPDPDITGLLSNQYIAPRNETETKLAALWKEILSVEQVGIYDNFFELGGHSLMVMRLLSSIKKELKIDIPVRALFELRTIEELANYIKLSHQGQQVVADDYETIEL